MTHALVLARQAAELSSTSAHACRQRQREDLEKTIAPVEAGARGDDEEPRQARGDAAGRKTVDGFARPSARSTPAPTLWPIPSRAAQEQAQRTALVEGARGAHKTLKETVSPLVDDANFDLTLGLEFGCDGTDPAAIKAELHDLAENSAAPLEGLTRIARRGQSAARHTGRGGAGAQ